MDIDELPPCICNAEQTDHNLLPSRDWITLWMFAVFILFIGWCLGALSMEAKGEEFRGAEIQPTYAGACAACQQYQIPMVVGIACAPPSRKLWVACSVKSLPGFRAPCIVVCMPGTDWPVWRATLPPTATSDDILTALTEARRIAPKVKMEPVIHPHLLERQRIQQWQDSQGSGAAPQPRFFRRSGNC